MKCLGNMKYFVISKSYDNSTYHISSWGADSSLCVTNGPQMIGWDHCLLNASSRLKVHITFLAVCFDLNAHIS